jgi:hypothetical protein
MKGWNSQIAGLIRLLYGLYGLTQSKKSAPFYGTVGNTNLRVGFFVLGLALEQGTGKVVMNLLH